MSAANLPLPSPCFVLEESLLRRNLAIFGRLQQAAPIEVMLALKGFALFHCFPWLKPVLAGASASSLWEAQLAATEFGQEVHVYAPAYRAVDFAQILPLASHVTFNSLGQWQRFAPQVKQAGVKAGLRINPEYSPVKTDLYNPCVAGSRLGVQAAMLTERLPAGISGFLCHNLCESDHLALEKTLLHIEALFGAYLPQIEWLNLGGGHLLTRDGYGVNYAIGVLNQFHDRHPHLRLIMEPGAAVAWQTGFLLSTVEDLIVTPDFTHAMLDVSFTAHMPDCLEMPYRPEVRGSHVPGPGERVYRLGGSSCLAGDFIGDYAFETPLQIGDRLIFEDMMHYTLVKTTTFNGVYHPAIGCLRESGDFQLWRQFHYDDYRNRLG
ncbi:MAG: carboxynorspermidine decarboxylase [Cyanobacteriota bacterium]